MIMIEGYRQKILFESKRFVDLNSWKIAWLIAPHTKKRLKPKDISKGIKWDDEIEETDSAEQLRDAMGFNLGKLTEEKFDKIWANRVIEEAKEKAAGRISEVWKAGTPINRKNRN